jgi:hypothetical protein
MRGYFCFAGFIDVVDVDVVDLSLLSCSTSKGTSDGAMWHLPVADDDHHHHTNMGNDYGTHQQSSSSSGAVDDGGGGLVPPAALTGLFAGLLPLEVGLRGDRYIMFHQDDSHNQLSLLSRLKFV